MHKRPKLKQHGRVVHASTLGVYFKSPQLSTASGMVKMRRSSFCWLAGVLYA